MLRPKIIRRKPIEKSKKRRRRKTKQMRTITLRLPEDVITRLDRLLEWVQPRMRVLSGKEAGRSDIIRAVIVRGIEQTEKQFGLTEEPMGFVLVDEEP